MFHYENISSQLNDIHDKKKRNYSDALTAAEIGWIDWFASQSSWILPVELEYAEDPFNSYGIKCNKELYDDAMTLILLKPFDLELVKLKFSEEVQKEAVNIYIQLHQRYVTTPDAITILKRKFSSGIFGSCPRFNCEGQYLLPIGMDYDTDKSKICGWCPKCHDIYEVETDIDGAFYGPSFPHFFQQMAKDVINVKPANKTTVNFFGIPVETQFFSQP